MLVVAISRSLRTSKTDSGCKSYDRFRTGCSAVFPSSGSTGSGTTGNPFGMYLAVVPVVLLVVPLPGPVFQPVGAPNSPGGGGVVVPVVLAVVPPLRVFAPNGWIFG